MKGTIISQMISEGIMDVIHGGGHRIRRVIVDGLAITATRGAVYVFPWKDGNQDDPSVVIIRTDVEIPDELVASAHSYLSTQKGIQSIMEELECSDAAAEARMKIAVRKFRDWEASERLKDPKAVFLWDPGRFQED